MSLFNLSFIVLIATLLIILSPSFTNAHVLPRQEHPITTQKDIFCGTAYHAVPSHTTLMTLLQKTNNACRNFGALDPKSPINETNAISVKKVALNENTDCAVCIFWMYVFYLFY
jgi:hypothetical protein